MRAGHIGEVTLVKDQDENENSLCGKEETQLTRAERCCLGLRRKQVGEVSKMGSVDGWRCPIAHRKVDVDPIRSRKFLSWSYFEGSVLQRVISEEKCSL